MAQKRNLESLGRTIGKLIVCYGKCCLVPFKGLECLCGPSHMLGAAEMRLCKAGGSQS